jgi:3-hydroxybutyryl-CoA dehydrogenase
MDVSEKKKVAIIGAGQMAAGIALEFARFGYTVGLYGRREAGLQDCIKTAREDLQLMVETELITAEVAEAALGRIQPTTDIATAVSGAFHVVEAVAEDLALKQQIFSKLDELCPAEVTLASNSSGLKVDDCAATAKNHPERILITHYWQPAHLIPLVEVIGGTGTDKQVLDHAADLLRSVRKRVVVQELEMKTMPAGWGNALTWALGDTARKIIDQGGCSPQVVDDLIRFGWGRRMAYTAIYIRCDLTGLDFLVSLAEARGLKPWGPYKERVDRGELGMKSGKGIYDWSGGKGEKLVREFNTEMIRLLKMDMEKGDI